MLVAVAAWLGVVVIASAVAWFAIGRAGSEVLDPAAQQVTTPGTGTTTDPSATTPGTTTSTAPPTSAPPTTAPPTSAPPSTSSAPPAATPVDKVVTVSGGQAGFRCTGTALSLRFAQPATGWSVRTGASDGGATVRVEFESDGGRTRLEAACASGGPSVSVEEDGGGGGGGGDGDDD